MWLHMYSSLFRGCVWPHPTRCVFAFAPFPFTSHFSTDISRSSPAISSDSFFGCIFYFRFFLLRREWAHSFSSSGCTVFISRSRLTMFLLFLVLVSEARASRLHGDPAWWCYKVRRRLALARTREEWLERANFRGRVLGWINTDFCRILWRALHNAHYSSHLRYKKLLQLSDIEKTVNILKTFPSIWRSVAAVINAMLTKF